MIIGLELYQKHIYQNLFALIHMNLLGSELHKTQVPKFLCESNAYRKGFGAVQKHTYQNT